MSVTITSGPTSYNFKPGADYDRSYSLYVSAGSNSISSWPGAYLSLNITNLPFVQVYLDSSGNLTSAGVATSTASFPANSVALATVGIDPVGRIHSVTDNRTSGGLIPSSKVFNAPE